MKCSKCGKEIEKDKNYCPYCGNKIIQDVKVSNIKNALWKKGLLASLILFIFTVILKVTSDSWIWEFATVLLIISIGTFVFSIGYGFFYMKKNKQKMPIWYCTILGIIVAFIIIFIIAEISRQKMDNSANNAYDEAYDILSATQPIETYTPNQAGIFRNAENVVEEKFDKNNNMTYYKTKNANGTINEETFTYEYDNKNRLTRMANSKEEYVLINYNKNNQIASVINSYGYTTNYFYKGKKLWYKITDYNSSSREITYYQTYTDNDTNYVLESQFRNSTGFKDGYGYRNGGYCIYNANDFISPNFSNAFELLNFQILYDSNYLLAYGNPNATNANIFPLVEPMGYKNTLKDVSYGYENKYELGDGLGSLENTYTDIKYFDNENRILKEESSSIKYSPSYYKYKEISTGELIQFQLHKGTTDGNNIVYFEEQYKYYYEDGNLIKKDLLYSNDKLTKSEYEELEKDYINYYNENVANTDYGDITVDTSEIGSYDDVMKIINNSKDMAIVSESSNSKDNKENSNNNESVNNINKPNNSNNRPTVSQNNSNNTSPSDSSSNDTPVEEKVKPKLEITVPNTTTKELITATINTNCTTLTLNGIEVGTRQCGLEFEKAGKKTFTFVGTTSDSQTITVKKEITFMPTSPTITKVNHNSYYSSGENTPSNTIIYVWAEDDYGSSSLSATINGDNVSIGSSGYDLGKLEKGKHTFKVVVTNKYGKSTTKNYEITI